MAATARNVAKLAFGLFVFWAFIFVLTPRIVPLIPAWEQYCNNQDEKGLDSGAIYYSDVPITLESAAHIGEAVEKGMEIRRMRREQQK